MFTRRHPLLITATVVLLNIQAILGVFFGLSLMARLLAPGSSIIIKGAAIFAGPLGGAPLVAALASPIIAWGFWMLKPWAHQRAVLIEVVSLIIAGFELIDPVVNIGVPAARIIIAALILICLYAGSGVRALSRA